MWMLKLAIRPTAGLTFRRLPSSILHISTYPFLPPTTMSGFLRRLKMIEVGDLPQTTVTEPDYYTLPPQVCPLGAYPKRATVHRAKRQGIRDFKHNAFSRITRKNNSKEVYQLHTWEYLMADLLVGYVVSEEEADLEELSNLTNFGCKIGKEGYAYIESISHPTYLELVYTEAIPDTLIAGEALIGQPCEAFPLYRYQWSSETTIEAGSIEPSPIQGFVSFIAGAVDQVTQLDYYTNGNDHLPKSFIDELMLGTKSVNP